MLHFRKLKEKKTSGETERTLILPTRKMHNLFGKKNSKIAIDLHQFCSLSKWVPSNLMIPVSSEGFFGSSPKVSGTKNAGILYLIQLQAILGVGFPLHKPYPNSIPEMFGEISSKPRARSWMFSSIVSDVLRSPGVRFGDGG